MILSNTDTRIVMVQINGDGWVEFTRIKRQSLMDDTWSSDSIRLSGEELKAVLAFLDKR